MSIFIKYIRENTKMKGIKGKPIGVIVAVSKEELGWSLCHKKDIWDKKLGLLIATKRAKFGDIQKLKIKFESGNLQEYEEAVKKYPRLAKVEKVILAVEERIKSYDFTDKSKSKCRKCKGSGVVNWYQLDDNAGHNPADCIVDDTLYDCDECGDCGDILK